MLYPKQYKSIGDEIKHWKPSSTWKEFLSAVLSPSHTTTLRCINPTQPNGAVWKQKTLTTAKKHTIAYLSCWTLDAKWPEMGFNSKSTKSVGLKVYKRYKKPSTTPFYGCACVSVIRVTQQKPAHHYKINGSVQLQETLSLPVRVSFESRVET